jgi:tRNA(Arg) A34 adenosine deaminase TadA
VTPSITIDLPAWTNEAVDWARTYRSDDEKISLAIELALRNAAQGTGGPFGAAVFDRASGRLLGFGVNLVMPLRNSALHAEMVAIMMAEQTTGSYTLAAGGRQRELFTSCEPCAMCLGAVLWSGAQRLVCAAAADDARALGFDEGPVFPESYEYIQRAGIEIVRGLRRKEAEKAFQEYAKTGGAIYNGAGTSCMARSGG